MKNYAIICALLLFYIVPAIAQEEAYVTSCESADCGIVLALSGLRLREMPSFDSKTIVTIPFAAKVERKDIHPKDGEYDNPLYSPDSIPGWWEKIIWKGKTGYAFNAFLGEGIKKMDRDFYLLFEDAAACWSDAYASLEYHYYGLFLSKDGTKSEIKRIKPSFISFYGEDGGGGTIISADEKSESVFLFATKAPFAEDGPVKMHKMFPRWPQKDQTDNIIFRYETKYNSIHIPNSNFELSAFRRTADASELSIYLKDRATGKTQLLIEEFGLESAQLSWCGDLDRDGVQDFLITGSGSHSGYSFLYLSRNAGKGKITKRAGMYIWGDCC